MNRLEWQENLENLEKKKKFTKPPRSPTNAESYLSNFWKPKVGNIIFSPNEAPGEEYKILELYDKNPGQARIKNIDGNMEIIYLQDWHWSPSNKELDDLLIQFGVRLFDNFIMRNRITLAKPKTPEEYVSVIREIRKYSMIEEGEDPLDKYYDNP